MNDLGEQWIDSRSMSLYVYSKGLVARYLISEAAPGWWLREVWQLDPESDS